MATLSGVKANNNRIYDFSKVDAETINDQLKRNTGIAEYDHPTNPVYSTYDDVDPSDAYRL